MTGEAQHAFDLLKTSLTITRIFAFPSLKKAFILYTNASQFAMGAKLAEKYDRCKRVVCYGSKSRQVSKSQRLFLAARRELLENVIFTRHSWSFLFGHRFKLVTAYCALQWLHSFKEPDDITARWLEKLAPFNYKLKHRPANSIGQADGFSRIIPSRNAVAEIFYEPDPQFSFDIHAPNLSHYVSHDIDLGPGCRDEQSNPDHFSSCKRFPTV